MDRSIGIERLWIRVRKLHSYYAMVRALPIEDDRTRMPPRRYSSLEACGTQTVMGFLQSRYCFYTFRFAIVNMFSWHTELSITHTGLGISMPGLLCFMKCVLGATLYGTASLFPICRLEYLFRPVTRCHHRRRSDFSENTFHILKNAFIDKPENPYTHEPETGIVSRIPLNLIF